MSTVADAILSPESGSYALHFIVRSDPMDPATHLVGWSLGTIHRPVLRTLRDPLLGTLSTVTRDLVTLDPVMIIAQLALALAHVVGHGTPNNSSGKILSFNPKFQSDHQERTERGNDERTSDHGNDHDTFRPETPGAAR